MYRPPPSPTTWTLNRKEYRAQYMKDYWALPEVKARKDKYDRARRRQPGRCAQIAEDTKSWRQGDKGKESVRKQNARRHAERRGIPHTNYQRLVIEISRNEHNCHKCGKLATQADHHIPVGLLRIQGRLKEADDDVRPMCSDCHKSKTKEDQRLIRAGG